VRRTILLATLGLGAALPAPGLAFSLRSEVDATTVGVEDQLQLTVTVEGADGPDAVALPALTNLQVAGGPFQSTQISVVGGRMSQSKTWTWVLQPAAVGRAEVGAVTVEGESAPAIAIEVVAGSVHPKSPPRRRDPFGMDPFEDFFGQRRARPTEAKVAMVASPSRTSVRVGEPVVLTYYLYTQIQVADLQFKEAPQYAGFWVEDLERPKTSPSGEAATLDGESYRRLPVLQKLLFPTRAGTLTIPAATFRLGLPAQGFFDSGGAVERATKPVRIEVDPLPDEPGFSGAVGRFEAGATLDRDTLPLGEAALLRFRVEGSGNLKWIDRPPAVDVEGARVYPPQVKSDLRTTPRGIEGSRTWEFVVVPETTGALEIPPIEFSYFDPGADRLLTARTSPLPLHVEGGTGAAGVPPSAASAGAFPAGTLPLRADLDPDRLLVPALDGRAILLLAGGVLVGHVLVWGSGRARGAWRGAGRRPSPGRSVKAALRDLERAGRDGLSKEQAAVLVERALHEAFGEMDKGDEGERARAVQGLLSEVHFVRYAPQLGDYSEHIRDLVARAAETVRRWA
jgi:hypothetical protein